jgi:hypothetical protein
MKLIHHKGAPTRHLIERNVSLNKAKNWELVDDPEEDTVVLHTKNIAHTTQKIRLDRSLSFETTFRDIVERGISVADVIAARNAGHPAPVAAVAANANVAPAGANDVDEAEEGPDRIIMGRKGRTVAHSRVPGKKVNHRHDDPTDPSTFLPETFTSLAQAETLLIVETEATRKDYPMHKRAKHYGGGCNCCKQPRPSRSLRLRNLSDRQDTVCVKKA